MQTTTRQYLDCPAAGPQDVTDEYRAPTRAGGSFIRNTAAAEALGLDWTAYTRRVGNLGYEDRVLPETNVQALVCPACGRVARVWIHGRPVQTPGNGHERRAIEIKGGASARKGGCNGVCLNGKRSCDCRCNGRCHGAGQCRCAA